MVDNFVGAFAQVALAEQDADFDMFCRRGCEVAFDPAWVQLAIERSHQKEGIEIGGDNLLVRLVAGKLAREVVYPRHQRVNDRLSRRAGRFDGNPVADRGKLPLAAPPRAAVGRSRCASASPYWLCTW